MLAPDMFMQMCELATADNISILPGKESSLVDPGDIRITAENSGHGIRSKHACMITGRGASLWPMHLGDITLKRASIPQTRFHTSNVREPASSASLLISAAVAPSRIRPALDVATIEWLSA